jgi:hypothetical protein
MKVIGKDLIFTDPCYIAKDGDWGDSFDYEVEGIGYPGFTEYEWEDTGYGDGSPKVYSIPTYYNPNDFLTKVINADDEELEELEDQKEYIGECGVDSGSFGVFLLDEVLKYNPKFLDSLPKNCYCIIRNFTGTVYPAYDDEGYTHFIFKPSNPITRPIITD